MKIQLVDGAGNSTEIRTISANGNVTSKTTSACSGSEWWSD